jgi:hypothetical protein
VSGSRARILARNFSARFFREILRIDFSVAIFSPQVFCCEFPPQNFVAEFLHRNHSREIFSARECIASRAELDAAGNPVTVERFCSVLFSITLQAENELDRVTFMAVPRRRSNQQIHGRERARSVVAHSR